MSNEKAMNSINNDCKRTDEIMQTLPSDLTWVAEDYQTDYESFKVKQHANIKIA